jgi:tetratricopeptide (TPR) repeat protein
MCSVGHSVRRRLAVWTVVLGLSIHCGPARPSLLPVSLPDLSRVDQAVQVQARTRYETLTRQMKTPGTPDVELAAAYGQYGMLLQAAEYYDAAEPAYLNAQALAPNEMRWPYYLAHIYKNKGNTAKARGDFKRVLELRPNDFSTLIWLGRLALDDGQPEEAEPFFSRALTERPRSIPALAGLGSAALAKHDYAAAVKHLEEALEIDPQAESLHSPLAMAYRGLGSLDKAEPHLRQWKNREILVPDPLRQELDLLLESGLSYELRGVRALEAKNWTGAAGFFRRGVELTTENSSLRRSLQHKLGTALFMAGDLRGAERQFEEVVREAPGEGIDESSAKAHYSLGVMRASEGQTNRAIEHFTSAVTYQPNYVEAQLALADLLRRNGQSQASLVNYRRALEINPRASQARLGFAIALSSLGRYREARDWLTEAMKTAPDHPEFAHALARVLSTAPDEKIRDGSRAQAIVQGLLEKQKTTDLGETLAMTLAELGQFDKAAAVQRGVLNAAVAAHLPTAVRRMTDNLRLYEQHRPCRIPWRVDEVAVIPALSELQAGAVSSQSTSESDPRAEMASKAQQRQ